jgi:hypothetical protein
VAWFVTVGAADKSLWLFRDHLHELLNEPDWPQTLEQMLDWLDARIPRRMPLPPLVGDGLPHSAAHCEMSEHAVVSQ